MAVEYDGGVVIGADSRTTRGYAMVQYFLSELWSYAWQLGFDMVEDSISSRLGQVVIVWEMNFLDFFVIWKCSSR